MCGEGGGGMLHFCLDLGLGVENGRGLTEKAGCTGRGVVALSGRAGRDSSLGIGVRVGEVGRGGRGAVALVSGRADRGSSLGNGGRVGLNRGGEKELTGRVGSLNLEQTEGNGGQVTIGLWGPLGMGTTGLIPLIELGEELDWGDESSALIALF